MRDLIIFLSVVRDNKGLSLTSIKKGTYSTALVFANNKS
nr:MAG TPA: hypothetical protein [Bacteriophage sp.]